MNKVAMTRADMTPDQLGLLKSYQIGVDADGEPVNQFKYRPGTVRQYRFDGKAGVFNIGGDDVIGKSFSFQPIAWRFFTGDILGMGVKKWAEVFFINERNEVSGILFHGYSVDNLLRLEEPLFWGDQKLSDVVITATAEKKQSKAENGGTYFMAQFTYAPADPAKVALYADYVADVSIYRPDTLNATCHISISENYPIGVTEQYVAELSGPATAEPLAVEAPAEA